MKKASLATVMAIAALAAPGSAQAAICAPNTTVCVTGVEENVATVVGVVNDVKTTVEGQVNQTVNTATAAVSATARMAAQETRDAANATLTPIENANAVCAPAPSGTTPICVTGAGTAVVGAETTVCEQAAASAQVERLIGYLVDRCYTGYP